MKCSHEIALNRSHSLVKALATITILLVLASIAGQLFKYLTGHGQLYGLIPLFNLDAESNLPTFYSALLLFLSALLLTIIGALKKRSDAPYAIHWLLVALIMLYLSIDESAKLHELMSRPTTTLLGGGTNGIFYRTWVLPALALVLIIGLASLKFLLHLPSHTKRLFCLAAILYVGGAVGLEVIAGHYAEKHGFDTLAYIALATLEETLEMTAVIVLIHALLTYIETHYGQIRLHFHPSPQSKI